MSGRRLGFLIVGCAFALAACSVDATLTVRMYENGSGTVSVRVILDAAAVRVAEIGGGKLEDRVRLSDLPAAGWNVTRWRRAENGGASLVVSKPFARAGEVAGIVAELNGPAGPLRRFRASRDVSTFSSRWKVRGAVDLRKLDLGIADDPELVAKLTDERVDIPAVESKVTSGLLGGLHVRAVADLPGRRPTVVDASPGERAVLVASADQADGGRVVLLGVGIGSGLLAVFLLVVGERRRHHRRVR